MAKSSMVSDVLVLGAVGVGVYFAWPWISGLFSSLTTPAAVAPAAGTTPATTTTATPISTLTPVTAPTCPTASYVCPDGSTLTQIPTGPNCNVLAPWGTCPTGGGNPCASVNPIQMYVLNNLVAQGTDPTAIGTSYGVSQGCLAVLAGQAAAVANVNQAKKLAGLGAVRPALMTRANRRNYVRRVA
jgi:hypothetical protein